MSAASISADLFIVMDYMDGGSLAHRIASKSFPRITENEARLIMARLFSALAYLHARGIVHRNVKPENILLQSPGEQRWPDTVRLSDFRMACFLDAAHAPSLEASEFAYQLVGTPDYMAPEAAVMVAQPDGSRRPTLGTETDMWAAGVTLYNILSQGMLPFQGATAPEVMRNARHAAIPFDTYGCFRGVSDTAMSLIRALLNPDRRKRPSADSVLYHPWFDAYDLRSRGSVMRHPPHVGYQKFCVAVSSIRFLIRMLAMTPGMPRVRLSPGGMHVVRKVANVNLPSAILSTTLGINIEPNPAMLASSENPHGFVKLGNVNLGGMNIDSPGSGLAIAPSRTPHPPYTVASPPPVHPMGTSYEVARLGGGGINLEPTVVGGGEADVVGGSGFHFTTSTLAPIEATAPVLRVSQTSSLGSQSFRSSHESSQLPPRHVERTSLQDAAVGEQQEEHSRRQLQVEHETHRQASSLREEEGHQQRLAAERQRAQLEAHILHQRKQEELMQRELVQRQLQEQQLLQHQLEQEQRQHLHEQQMLSHQQQVHPMHSQHDPFNHPQQQQLSPQQQARGSGGLRSGILGAMRRDSQSNPTSRAGSHLLNSSGGGSVAGSGAGDAATGGMCTGEMSAGSTRSHMQTGVVGVRMDSNPGDESMGSGTSSPSGSNRSMHPVSRPGSDGLSLLEADPELGGGLAPMPHRTDSGMALGHLAPALALSGDALAGISHGAGSVHQDGLGLLRGESNPGAPSLQRLPEQPDELRYQSRSGHVPRVDVAPNLGAPQAGGSAGHTALDQPEQAPSGKDKKSKKKFIDNLRAANFAGFGFGVSSKGD